MIARALLFMFVLAFASSARAGDAPAPAGTPFAAAIDSAVARVVKIYGAAVGREKGYASGIIVSADGQIVTGSAPLLEGRSLRAVLADGRVFPAQVVARDERRQLALLKIEAENLPHFELAQPSELQPGDWIISAANAFKVADGPEPVSVMSGIVSAIAPLDARHRTQDFPYKRDAIFADVIVSTPGSAGGALVDAHGRLAGIIGRPVIGKQSNTWLNYGLPAREIAAFLEDAKDPQKLAAEIKPEEPANAGITETQLGLLMFNLGGRVRPAYVERVRAGSPADRAGIRPNDLILSVNGQNVASCEELRAALRAVAVGAPLSLAVKRGEAVQMVETMVAGDQP
jgi:serine protease Do